MTMLSSNMQSGAADRPMEGCEAPLHVQGKPRQQQLVHDLMVAMAGGQVAGGHALGVIAGHVAACYDQLGHHVQVTTLCCMMQRCTAHTHTSLHGLVEKSRQFCAAPVFFMLCPLCAEGCFRYVLQR